MNKSTRLFALLAGVICMGSVFMAGACDDGEKPNPQPSHTTHTDADNDGKCDVCGEPVTPQEHEHTYAKTWTYDENTHWHAATCGHDNLKSDEAAHTFNGRFCTVCDYAKPLEKHTVTFNPNYTGAGDPVTSEAEDGMTVDRPTDPTRSGYTFTDWYTEAEGGTVFNFSTPITSDLELFAHWVEDTVSLKKVTFEYNRADMDPLVMNVQEGEAVDAPTAPTFTNVISSADGKFSYQYADGTVSFSGWYQDEALSEEYDFEAAVTEDITLYAKWDCNEVRYTFEAELVNLSGKTGLGYSTSHSDAGMIRYDSADRAQEASWGHSVGYMYEQGLFIDFVIYSDRDVEGVWFDARLSAEFRDIYIAPEDETIDGHEYGAYWIMVNGTRLDYEPIALTGAQPMGVPDQRKYTDHEISLNVTLNRGENVIRFYVANSNYYESTINAMAPMIDCIYLTADALLSWKPVWDNMNHINYEND